MIGKAMIEQISKLWQQYQTNGYGGIKDHPPSSAEEAFYLCLLAYGEQDISRASHFAQEAVKQSPDDRLYPQAAQYLRHFEKTGSPDVYAKGDGFAAFIRGGGNVALYQKTTEALVQTYRQYNQNNLRLLDIGTGEGMALLPAITPNLAALDVLEPSRHLLDLLESHLKKTHIPYRAHCTTIQAFSHETEEHWDLMQATFSLHSIPAEERPGLFSWASQHCSRLIMVEFEVPLFSAIFAPERVTYMMSTYHTGLAEYQEETPETRDLVYQGFLMPVFFGCFDRTTARLVYEQPISLWEKELSAAGFGHIHRQRLYDYWWAPAYLIDASPGK